MIEYSVEMQVKRQCYILPVLLWVCVLQLAPVLNGDATMDSVSHPSNAVMETGSVLMAVMN